MNTPRFFDSIPHLEALLADFSECVVAAQQLATPNAEDDELIRCGMIGFARHLSLDRWDHVHFRYVSALRNEVCRQEFSVGWRRFTSLAAGYFLGMRVAGHITDVDLRLSEAQTPGFMWMHAAAFDCDQNGGHTTAG